MFELPSRVLSLLPVAVIAMTVAGCASTPGPADRGVREISRGDLSVGEQAAAVARGQVGVPYRYGGSSVRGFDCSGLVQYAYAAAGKRLPRTTGAMWRATRAVPRDDLRVGDLLFFSIEGKMSHVGLYLGDGRFVHAPSSGRHVTVASLDSVFYRGAFLRGGRPD